MPATLRGLIFSAALLLCSTTRCVLADAAAPDAATSVNIWPECDEKDGDATHSIMAIVTGAYQQWVLQGEPSVLLPMLQNVDNATHDVLNTFDLSVPGHTLIMPKNVGKDYRDYKYRNFNLTTIFNIDPATVPPEVATEIIKAHLIPETLTYYELEQKVQNGSSAVYTSLQGLPWSFSWRTNVAGTGGYLVLDDLYLVTYERGYLDVEGDILNTAKNKCPNTVFALDLFLAMPAYLQTDVVWPLATAAATDTTAASTATYVDETAVSAFPPTAVSAFPPTSAATTNDTQTVPAVVADAGSGSHLQSTIALFGTLGAAFAAWVMIV